MTVIAQKYGKKSEGQYLLYIIAHKYIFSSGNRRYFCPNFTFVKHGHFLLKCSETSDDLHNEKRWNFFCVFDIINVPIRR